MLKSKKIKKAIRAVADCLGLRPASVTLEVKIKVKTRGDE